MMLTLGLCRNLQENKHAHEGLGFIIRPWSMASTDGTSLVLWECCSFCGNSLRVEMRPLPLPAYSRPTTWAVRDAVHTFPVPKSIEVNAETEISQLGRKT